MDDNDGKKVEVGEIEAMIGAAEVLRQDHPLMRFALEVTNVEAARFAEKLSPEQQNNPVSPSLLVCAAAQVALSQGWTLAQFARLTKAWTDTLTTAQDRDNQ